MVRGGIPLYLKRIERILGLKGMEARPFAQLLRAAFDDQALAAQAQAASPAFRARMTKPAEVEAADLVETLLD